MNTKTKLIIALICASAFYGCAPMQVRQSEEMFLNGIRLTKVAEFPAAAWGGLPQIQSASDLNDMAKIVSLMGKTSVAAAQKGNSELAVASWFWYRQYASKTLSVMDGSLKAISSMNGRSAGAIIPANSLVVLPSFDRYQTPASMMGANQAPVYAVIEHKGVMLAGGGDGALSDAVRQIVQNRQQPINPAQRQAVADIPLNTPVRLDNGLYLERRKDALVIYNQNSADTTVPLREINYIPSMPEPSEMRKSAAPYMYSMRDAVYRTLVQKNKAGMSGEVNVRAPNYVVVGTGTMGHTLDGVGQITTNPKEAEKGQRAYRTNPAYSLSVDLLARIPRDPAVSDFNSRCFTTGFGYTYEFTGNYAEILRASCANGSSYSRDFFITGNAAIQTYESILEDKEIVGYMKNAVARANAIDDATSLLPLWGNIENALQCAGTPSISEYINVRREGGRNAREVAMMAGWKRDEGNLADTAISCVGAIPVVSDAGVAIKGAAAGVKALSKSALAAKTDKFGSMLEVFRSERNLDRAAERAAALFPDNKDLARMLHKGYNIFQTSLNAHQTTQGFEQMYADYAAGK